MQVTVPAMTSRICIKNLPKYCDEARLREHFAAKGEVTDAKVMRTKGGHSRQFGFIGYRTETDAEAAVKYFNNSFMDTSKLTVEYAYDMHARDVHRPWSKYSEGSSAHDRVNKDNAKAAGPQGVHEDKADKAGSKKKKSKQTLQEEDDPELREFLSVMQPRSKQAIWGNDDVTLHTAAPGSVQQAAGKDVKFDDDSDVEDEDDDMYVEITNRQAQEDASEEEDDDDDEDDIMEEEKDEVVVDPNISDLDYLKSRVTTKFSDDDEDDEEEDEEEDSDDGVGSEDADTTGLGDEEEEEDAVTDDGDERAEEKEQHEEESNDEDGVAERKASGQSAGPRHPAQQQQEVGALVVDGGSAESIAETGRLFVRNLAYTTTEDDLRQAFSKFGDVAEVHLVADKATKKSRGIAYILFTVPEDAVKAHEQLDGSILHGRLLHILPAKKPPAPPEDKQKQNAGSSFKTEREEQRKSEAGNRAAWNTLFMRSDTVAEAIAAYYSISKSELLDRDAADLPVRMALGETHVIAQTKKALGDAGVNIAALEAAAAVAGKASQKSAVKRSQVALIVKNLPFSASEDEIMDLFGGCGPISRFVLPPTKTMAVVEYLDAQDARKAFRTLAYRRYQHVPIYLEWAPEGLFSGPAPSPKAVSSDRAADSTARPGSAKEVADAAALMEGEADGESCTLYVKNLSFGTEDAALRKHFSAAAVKAGGGVRSALVARKKGPNDVLLSTGFGFVECSSEAVAKAVSQQLQGSVLEGHKLVVQLSTRKVGSGDKAALAVLKPAGTKLLVRNIAFEATRKDVFSLFNTFGHIKNCRLPRKFDGSPRGFAFVDFLTKQEAKNAMEAVQGAHLYGRRLVIEWAEEEDGLDELREKTSKKFKADSVDALQPTSKRMKASN